MFQRNCKRQVNRQMLGCAMEGKKMIAEKERIKLSVIIPVYNVEKYIKRCLDSILAQTYGNLEIIVVDDGATDGSGEICDAYARKDTRIKVIHKENGGIVSARKAGVLHATGGYTTNVDSDDWVEPGAFEAMVEGLEKYRPDMLAMGYKKEHEGFLEEYPVEMKEGFYRKEEFWSAFNEKVHKTAFFCHPVDMSLCNKAIRTELWKKHQLNCPDDLKKNVDDAVIFPCLLDINSIYVDSGIYYHYCVRKKSITWKIHNHDYEYFLKLSEYLIASYRTARGKDMMDRNFLLYKIFYHLALDIPEKLIDSRRCMIYPQVVPKSHIIVYGKGVFAHRLTERMNDIKYCSIVANVDKSDAQRLLEMDDRQYDYIVVAIFNAAMAMDAVALLAGLGVKKDRILCMDKKNMTVETLPDDVGSMWRKLM